jgi:hypothetical protein
MRGALARRVQRVAAAALLIAAAGCSKAPRTDGPLHLVTKASGPDTRLTLYAAPHLKVSAQVAPALELRDGGVLRFRTGRRTADSAYFAEPPSAVLPGRHESVHGTLRASVCRDDEQICRSLSVEI